MYDCKPNADGDLMVAHGVSVHEGVELQILLVVQDHLQELPVRVPGVPVSQNLRSHDSHEMRFNKITFWMRVEIGIKMCMRSRISTA